MPAQSGGQEQAGCPICNSDTKVQVAKLLQCYEKLQELVESFMSQQMVGRSKAKSCWRGGLGEGLLESLQLVALHCHVWEHLAAPQIVLCESAACPSLLSTTLSSFCSRTSC